MKSIKIILFGEDIAPKLTLGKPETGVQDTSGKTEQVHVEDVTVNEEKPELGDNVTIPRDVLELLVSSAKKNGKKKDEVTDEDKFERAIAKLTEALENQSPTVNHFLGQRPVDMYSIDKDDVLEVPAVFFAHSVNYMILDDRKNGMSISTPYKRIFKFKKVIRTVTSSPGNRTPVYLSISACFVNSKKEVEWLKQHSLFGIKFFEKLGDGRDISAEMQDKLVTAWNIVSSFDEHTVVQRCSALGIPIKTMDMAELKRTLAKKMAASAMKDLTASARRAVEDFGKFQSGNVEVVGAEQSTEQQSQDLKVAEPTY